MDEQHFDALRRWGHGLLEDPREEVHAAGRAIVLLCAEVDRLERELWNEKTSHAVEANAASDEPVNAVEGMLRARVRQAAQSLSIRRVSR